MECAHSFVSDHVGYKFVEPVQFDLGRVKKSTKLFFVVATVEANKLARLYSTSLILECKTNSLYVLVFGLVGF